LLKPGLTTSSAYDNAHRILNACSTESQTNESALVRKILPPVAIVITFFFTNMVNAQWIQADVPTAGWVPAFAISGSAIFAGIDVNGFRGGGGIFRSLDTGASWTSVGLRNTEVTSFAASGGAIFAGAQAKGFDIGGGVFRSTNNGRSWTLVGLANTDVVSLAVSGSALFAGTRSTDHGVGGVFLSTNYGMSWVAVDSGLPERCYVASLAVSGSTVFAGTGQNDYDAGGDIFRSTNNGTSWNAADSGLTSIDTWVEWLAVSESAIFAGAENGVFLSTNNGTSWTSVDYGFKDYYGDVSSFATSGGAIFAGTGANGIFLSTNNGKSWTSVDYGLSNLTIVTSLAVFGGALFAGTESNGVWRRPLSEMIGGTYHPRRTVLNQSNFRTLSSIGANANVTIEFSLPQSDKVTVAVYNLSGHELASLINKNLSQGSYSITWNTGNVAPGCYAVQLKAGSNAYIKSIPIFR
jgi:hypothetical protein